MAVPSLIPLTSNDSATPASDAPGQVKEGANVALLNLGLHPLIVHFNYPGYIFSHTLDTQHVKILKKTCTSTARDASVREELGNSPSVWKNLTDLFYAAARSFAERCYAPQQPDAPTYNAASSARIVQNHQGLIQDVARVKDLVAICRNILNVGEPAQNLAAKMSCDHAIFQLIVLSVKVTARGFDQNGNPSDEEKWQLVINDFKKLLVRCLEFLNNLTAQNERRKLMLWVELFHNSNDQAAPADANKTTSTNYPTDQNGNYLIETAAALQKLRDAGLPPPPEQITALVNAGVPGLDSALLTSQPGEGPENINLSPYLVYIGRLGSIIGKDLLDQGKLADPAEIAKECKRRWDALTPEQRQEWGTDTANWLRSAYNARGNRPEDNNAQQTTDSVTTAAEVDPKVDSLRVELGQMRVSTPSSRPDIQMPLPFASHNPILNPVLSQYNQQTGSSENPESSWAPVSAALPEPTEATEEDYRVEVDAKYGLEELDRGKQSLLSSLDTESQRSGRSRRRRSAYTASPVSASTPVQNESRSPAEGAASDIVEPGSEEEDESDEDDYPVPGDDGRGLLTDVPLILGPTEIEVLPMIILSGIVPPTSSGPGHGNSQMATLAIRNMHAVRCHLLLAQNNGQNLLRELLIFVAAWDLREDELYFKLLVKIMDAILMNGLMPFSYHAFRESKDIISPAQAVIMKLLTNIFRARQSEKARQAGTAPPVAAKLASLSPGAPHLAYPTTQEAQTIKFLFREFREQIIPQTCSLIFLQGKIRDGTVSPEDFPFNLWDMERMYEGIYQYLEFFAILTEHEKWKTMMSNWEITSELVTLLEELDVSIPRSTPMKHEELLRRAQQEVGDSVAMAAGQGPPLQHQQTQQDAFQYSPPEQTQSLDHNIAVERPYDVNTMPFQPRRNLSSFPQQPAVNLPMPGDMGDLSVPLNPADPDPYAPINPAPPPPPQQQQQQQQQPLEDEACDFEWRNLKKLAVLVLSSLVWKSPLVQDQLAQPDSQGKPGRGIRALLNCCKVDDYNPYIKEHAIMALRFALENSTRNMEIVRELQKGERERAQAAEEAAARAAELYPNLRHAMPGTRVEHRGQVLREGGGAPTQGSRDVEIIELDEDQSSSDGGDELEFEPGHRSESGYDDATVPNEILDLNGYETYVDASGQVQLKRRSDAGTEQGGSTSVSRG